MKDKKLICISDSADPNSLVAAHLSDRMSLPSVVEAPPTFWVRPLALTTEYLGSAGGLASVSQLRGASSPSLANRKSGNPVEISGASAG